MNEEVLIEKYFEGTLTQDEQTAFNELLKTNKAFANEVTLQQQLKTAITIQERAKTKNFLKNIDTSQSQKVSSFKWLYAAAAILLIVLSGIWVFTQKPDGKELFAAYYQPYPNTIAPIVRGENNTIKDSVYIAFAAYENKEYTVASAQFNALYNSTGKSYFKIYEAVCLLALDKSQEAIQILTKNIYEEEDTQIIKNWYLALAYIKQNNFANAKPLLQQVVATENIVQQPAQKLLEKLP
jgi:predicted Zn-dependent protease